MCARTRGCLLRIAGVVLSTFLVPSPAAAAPWTSADVGAVKVKGSATAAKNNRIKVSGEGAAGVGGSADAFHYFHQPLAADGAIVVRLVSLQNTAALAKGGVMLRQSLAAGAVHASLMVTPGSGIVFQRRAAPGGASAETRVGGSAPRWLRLVRIGTTITASVSTDGATWTAIGTASVPFSGPIYAGLAVTSAKSGRLMATTFERLSLSAVTPPPPPPPSGPVAAWSFDEGRGSIVQDQFGVSHGAISGAAWTASGKYGRALLFDGMESIVTIPGTAALNLSDAMTIEAWVYPMTLASVRNLMMKEGSGGPSYALYANADRPVPAGYVATNGGEAQAACNNQLAVNAWSHLAATYDGVTLRLFVNGAPAGSSTVSGPLVQTGGALRIGGNALWGEFFHGAIDNVRIYKRALSASEIGTSMNTAVPPAQPPPDTTAPAVSITAPASGSTVGGVVTVSASASDDVGVTRVQLQVNGANLGSALTSAPYAVSWDTTGAPDGSYVLTATARDAAGNTKVSAAVTVTVSNAVAPPPPEPRYIEFTSPDHNRLLATGQWAITSYTLEVWQGAQDPLTGQPYRSTSVGRPAAAGQTVLIDQQAFLSTLPKGQSFYVTLLAIGPGGSSRSSASNVFVVP